MLASGGVRLHPEALAALAGGQRRIWPWVALAIAGIALVVTMLR